MLPDITMIELSFVEEKEESRQLKEFGDKEWESADREHYGDQPVDFTKRPFSLVARENGRIVGYVRLTLDMGVFHLESILIAESHRRQGIGATLMASAEEHGRRLGAHKIWLETGKTWGAKELYLKMGYRICAELPNYYAHHDFVLMDKDL